MRIKYKLLAYYLKNDLLYITCVYNTEKRFDTTGAWKKESHRSITSALCCNWPADSFQNWRFRSHTCLLHTFHFYKVNHLYLAWYDESTSIGQKLIRRSYIFHLSAHLGIVRHFARKAPYWAFSCLNHLCTSPKLLIGSTTTSFLLHPKTRDINNHHEKCLFPQHHCRGNTTKRAAAPENTKSS